MTKDVKSVENDFFNWLSGQVSSVQLSNLYTVFASIENFCVSRKILRKRLFETTDIEVISEVRDVVDKDQTFKYTYKKQQRIMSQAIHYYLQYIKEYCPQAEYSANENKTRGKNRAELTEKNDPLVELLVRDHIPFVDFRNKSGCLWVVGGTEYRALLEHYKKYGIIFHFKKDGAHATGGKPAWWTTGKTAGAQAAALPETQEDETTDEAESKSAEETARKSRIQFLHWLQERGIDVGKSVYTLSALKKIGECANRLNVLKGDIFLMDSALKFRPVYDALKANASFIRWDKKNNGKCMAVLNSYMDCLNGLEKKNTLKAEEKPKAETAQKAAIDPDLAELLKDELFAPLREALSRQGIRSVQGLRETELWPFMNRYNLYTLVTRQTVLERVQKLLSDMDETDDGRLYCLVCAGREYRGISAAEAYLHFCEELARRYPLRFRGLIGRHVKPNGPAALRRTELDCAMLKMTAPIAYIPCDLPTAAVLENTAWLYEMCTGRAVDVSMHEPAVQTADVSMHEPAAQTADVSMREPAAQTADISMREPAVQTADPVSEKEETDKQDRLLIAEMEKTVLEADLEGISFDDLKSKMGLTMAAVRRIAQYEKRLVEIKDKLYHEGAFVGWDEGAEQLEAILDKLMQKNNGYVSAAQLYEYAHIDMRLFLNDNDLDDERSVYEMAQHLFEQTHYKGKTYTFTGKMHISDRSADIGSNFDICRKYAGDQGGVFRYSELVEYLTALGIKVGNLRNQLRLYSHPDFFYYEEGTLISADSMHIDDEWKETVKNALDKLFRDVGDHIVLREIQPFWFDQLPWLPGGRRWTPLLLQSVLRFWGEEFGARTIIAMDTQGMETLHTMLVQKDSPIQNFGDAVVSVLIENDMDRRSFEAEELRQLLVEENLIRGNELFCNMPKALGGDERFSWDAKGEHVTILV